MPFKAVTFRRVRHAALILIGAASIMLAAAPAQAMTVPGQGVSGPAASVMVGTGAAAAQPASARGCSVWVCITVTGNASFFTVTASQLVGWCGHFQFLFPHQHSNSGSGCNITSSADGSGAGKVCVVGWQQQGSGFTNVGEPCETVR
jgi:hypothetical protein